MYIILFPVWAEIKFLFIYSFIYLSIYLFIDDIFLYPVATFDKSLGVAQMSPNPQYWLYNSTADRKIIYRSPTIDEFVNILMSDKTNPSQ